MIHQLYLGLSPELLTRGMNLAAVVLAALYSKSMQVGQIVTVIPLAVVEIERIQDPRLPWLIVVLIVMIIGVVVAGVWRWAITRHPCQGWLVIVDANSRRVPGGLYGLSGRNRHVFKEVPPEVGIRRVEVTSKKEWQNESHIRVRIVPHEGRAWEPFEMTPSRRPITNNYSLLYVQDQQQIPR